MSEALHKGMAERPIWSAIQSRDIAPGAQTERRGGAGPVTTLLGGRDVTGLRLPATVVCGHPPS